jgi:hypothetical protein
MMRLYQTWIHDLYPEATFKDLITQAESEGVKERRLMVKKPTQSPLLLTWIWTSA